MLARRLTHLKAAHIFLLTITVLVFLYLLHECFIFSANYEIESWRGVDDIAFQHSLLSFFPYLHGAPNDYGYGWLFWFSNAVVSYPGYILHHFFGYDRLLIVSPRLLSLVLSFAGLYFFYRIFSFYCQNLWLCAVATLFLLSYPTFGFYSTYFGTAAHVFFYSILTVYFLLCTDITQWSNQKKLILAIAAAGAVKLTGLLIAPAVGLIFLDKNIRAGKLTVKNFLKLAIFFIAVLVFFIRPSLYLSPFRPESLHQYITVMQFYFHQVATAQGDSYPWYWHAKNDLIQFSLSVPIFIILFLSLIVQAILRFKRQSEFFYMIVGYLISAGYLIAFVKEGGTYITLYSHSINWMPLFGLLLYEGWCGFFIPFLMLILNLWLNHSHLILSASQDSAWLGYNAFSYFEEKSRAGMLLQKDMQTLIEKNNSKISAEKVRILLLFPAPVAFSSFNPYYDVVYIFNSSPVSFDPKFNYVIVSSDADVFDKKKVQQMAPVQNIEAEKYRKNQKLFAELMMDKKLGSENCQQLLQREKVTLFKCN